MTDAERANMVVRAAVSSKARGLVSAVIESEFNAGQAYDNDETDYTTIYNTSVKDATELLEYIAELEARPAK